MSLETVSGKIFGNRFFLLFLIFANLAGFFVGLHYYWEQLIESSPLLWIVIIDSPLSVLLFAVVCVLMYFGKEQPELLKFLACVYVIKYGLWTMLAISLYWGNYVGFEDQVTGVINFFLHFGMVVEGAVLAPRISVTKYNTVIVLMLALANDFFDYFLGTVTRIPETYVNFLALESFVASVLIVFLIFIFQRRKS